ncbi:polysaccharide biosynthesis protein [Alphaproteobacteria bacterium]|nr:polysaccharide biosynthesis protein [Alphaproteobacteria bacterium]
MNINRLNLPNILQLALSLNRNVKRALQITFDSLAIFCSLTAAMFLRTETLNFLKEPTFLISYLIILIPTIMLFLHMGLYRSFMRYVSTEIALLVAIGSCTSGIFLIILKITLAQFIPWSTPIIFCALLFIIVTALRFILRALFRFTTKKNQKCVAIYGAGAAGVQLIQSLGLNSNFHVQMILDDNPNLHGQSLYGLKIISFEEALQNADFKEIDILLLAMPSANLVEQQKIIAKANSYSLEVKSIPDITSLIKGEAQITEFKNIEIEDLLGRERVNPLPNLMSKNIESKSVMVTGAGGSIGSELCRQIVTLNPKTLILFDISEIGIYSIYSELEQKVNDLNLKIIPLIGSVQDRYFLRAFFENQKVDTIYHAAAYKHVPLMEQNMIQSIKNNSIGSMIIAEEAIYAKIKTFTLVSTDKAVNPSNIMGASKRLAEKICQTMNLKQSKTRFSIVRFGNVLGSSGSVVPLFKKQIAEGGPISLTHPEVTRYFMTISEAVQLVIQASSLANKEGEVFVLDMGMPVKIKDLAFKMVQLLGLIPFIENDDYSKKGDIPIKITGLRPGEKMYEELSYNRNLQGTIHPRIMTVNETPINSTNFKHLINQLQNLINEYDYKGLIEFLSKNADYVPTSNVEFYTENSFLSKNKEAQEGEIIPLNTNKFDIRS